MTSATIGRGIQLTRRDLGKAALAGAAVAGLGGAAGLAGCAREGGGSGSGASKQGGD